MMMMMMPLPKLSRQRCYLESIILAYYPLILSMQVQFHILLLSCYRLFEVDKLYALMEYNVFFVMFIGL
ncbi:hypothetical protein ABFX02_06G127200 [Erythranthe guttata]